MAFHLKLHEDVAAGLRRIAIEQIDAGLRATADAEAGDAAPHALRKRCKKLRALLRLVRGSFGDYQAEQRALRDAARKLARVRDAAAHLQALERLCARDPDRYQGPDFDRARGRLLVRRDSAVNASQEQDCVEQARAVLRAQRGRVGDWSLREQGFEAIEAGLVETYRSARKALVQVRDEPSAERLHELRKHVKYHRFHLGLLHRHWPGPMTAVVHEAETLGEVLGEHHDIDVLLAALAQGDPSPELADATGRIAASVQPELERLERRAVRLARRLLAEKPRCLASRMRGYWNAGSA